MCKVQYYGSFWFSHSLEIWIARYRRYLWQCHLSWCYTQKIVNSCRFVIAASDMTQAVLSGALNSILTHSPIAIDFIIIAVAVIIRTYTTILIFQVVRCRAVRRRRRAAAADILLTPPPPPTECRRRAGAVFVTYSRHVVHQLYVASFLQCRLQWSLNIDR